MNFTLTLETNDAAILRAISTAAAMIEYHSDGDITSPSFALVDALTAAGWIADALNETLDDFDAVGLVLSEIAPAMVLQRLARRLETLATRLLAPPPTEEAKSARIAEARQMLGDDIAAGVSPAWIGPGDDDDDLFGFETIPA